MTKPETRRNHAKFGIATELRFDVIPPDATEDRAAAYEVAAARAAWLRSATDLRNLFTPAIDRRPA